jgi:hypothetical protein
MRCSRLLSGTAIILLAALPALAGWAIHGPDGGSVKRLVFDPTDASIVYAAASNGLFRSADGGQHWVAGAGLVGTGLLDVAVAKSDPRVIFAASASGLFKSTDRGASFHLVQSNGAFHLAVSRQNADIVYCVSINGPVQSTDGAATFGPRGSGLPAGLASAIAVDPQNAATVYVSFPTSPGVYKSTDSGAHWAPASSGLTAPQVFALAVDPSNGNTLYAGGRAPAILKSTDGAATWTALNAGPNDLTCAGVEVSPSSPSTLLAATNHGALRSTDGGASWGRGDGFVDENTVAVALDPVSPARFLAAMALHVYRTADGGTTSVLSEAGLDSFSTQAIAADPHDDAVVYAGGPGGFARSTDHGRTWLLSTAIAPLRLAVDANASTLYAAAGTLVYRSVDRGGAWTPFADGLPGVTPQMLTPDPQLSGTLYAVVNGMVYKRVGEAAWVSRNNGLPGGLDFVTVDPHASDTLYSGGPDGVFKSSDGGASWAAANNGLTGLNTVGLAVDPFDSRHIFAWSPTKNFVSTDAGASWSADPGFRGDRYFHPAAAGVAYSNSFADVQRSTDGGKTWSSLAGGLPESHALFAVGAGGTPYLGSFAGGVFALEGVRRRAVGR